MRIFGGVNLIAFGLLGGTASAIALSNATGRYAISNSGSSTRFAIDKIGGGVLNDAFGQSKGTIRIDGGDIRHSKFELTIFFRQRLALTQPIRTISHSAQRTCSASATIRPVSPVNWPRAVIPPAKNSQSNCRK